MKVFINPGHGGEDPGAINYNLDINERDICLEIGELLDQYLNEANINTMLVQRDNLVGEDGGDYRESVVAMSNKWDADLFISIHCNAYNRSARGTETYYGSIKGFKLATYIQDQLIDTLDTLSRGTKDGSGLIVIKHTDAVAVLVETAFIDNDLDARILIDRKQDIARAICRGIIDYISED